MRKYQNGFPSVELCLILMVLACGFGWALNIIKLVGVVNDPVSTMTVLRALGIPLAPLGVVLGYV